MLTRILVIAAMASCVYLLTGLFAVPGPRQASATTPSRVEEMAAGWTGVINYTPAYAALYPFQSATNPIAASLFDPADDYWGLPRTDGYENVAAYCAACHSLQIVMAQRQSRDGWDYLLTWMVEKQGMAEAPQDTRQEMLNYLAREFSAE